MNAELLAAIESDLADHAPKSPLAAADALRQIAERRIAEASGIDAEAILSAVLTIYDQFVAPLDIPGVPDEYEPTVDQLIRQALEILLRAFIARQSS